MTNATETPEAPAQYKTCRLTIVNPGFSDAYLKIYPAKQEKEVVWLDNQPGRIRWEQIKRILSSFVPRTEVIPDPLPAHADPEDLKSPTFKEDDIPVVTLDGHVFESPKEEERPKAFLTPQAKLEKIVENQAKEISEMRGMVKDLISAFTQQVKPPAAPVEASPMPESQEKPFVFSNKKTMRRPRKSKKEPQE